MEHVPINLTEFFLNSHFLQIQTKKQRLTIVNLIRHKLHEKPYPLVNF